MSTSEQDFVTFHRPPPPFTIDLSTITQALRQSKPIRPKTGSETFYHCTMSQWRVTVRTMLTLLVAHNIPLDTEQFKADCDFEENLFDSPNL